MLARAASDVKIGHVIRAIDGPLAPIACASRSAYEPCGDCKSVKACAVRFTMVKVREAISFVGQKDRGPAAAPTLPYGRRERE